MSIILLDGFDDGLEAERWPAYTPAVSATYGKNGNGARIGTTPGDYLYYGFATQYTDDTIGFWIRIVSTGSGYFWDTAIYESQINIYWDAAASRLRWTHYGASTLYTPVGSLNQGQWHYVEIRFKYNTVNGGIRQLWIDGVQHINQSGEDHSTTYRAGPTFHICSGIGEAYVDDVYITDAVAPNAGVIGMITVETLLPSGNGNSSGMLGSDGNSVDNYALVDENPPVDTDYVGSATEGDKDTYAMSDLAASAPVIKGLVVSTLGQKTDTGAKYLRHVVRTNSVDYVGASIIPGESWSLQETTWDEDPNTTAAWLYGAVNGMEVGQEVRDT